MTPNLKVPAPGFVEDDPSDFARRGYDRSQPEFLHRDENGRYVRSVFFAWDAEDALVDRAFEAQIDEYFTRTPTRGNPDLGTFRSKRRAADLKRERERVPACEVCGKA